MRLIELRNRVRDILNEPVPARWSDTLLNAFLNEGLNDIAKLTPALTETTISVKQGDTYIALPLDLLALDSLFYGPDRHEIKRALEPLPPDNTTLGTPEWYYPRADGNYLIWPLPDINTTVVVVYNKKPTQLSADTDEPSIAGADTALIAYAVWKACLVDGNFQAAALWEVEYGKEATKFLSIQDRNHSGAFHVRMMW